MQGSETIEINSQFYLDYTYHRHSAPKDVIYYRCSDKRCKARFHYNQKTKEYRLKNHHLDPSVHKPPKLTGKNVLTLGSRELAVPEKAVELHCEEVLPAPTKPEVDVVNIRLSVASLQAGNALCRTAVSQGLVGQASSLERGVIYSIENQRLIAQPCDSRVYFDMFSGCEHAVGELLAKEADYTLQSSAFKL